MANNWNVRAFFTVTHNDVLNCLSHLNDLRLANHTTATETAFLSEHVEVCALMRAKLVSEVEINKEKLKVTFSSGFLTYKLDFYFRTVPVNVLPVWLPFVK